MPVYFLLMSGMYVVLQLIGFSLLCMPKRDLEAEAAASESAEKKRKRLRKINSLGVRYCIQSLFVCSFCFERVIFRKNSQITEDMKWTTRELACS